MGETTIIGLKPARLFKKQGLEADSIRIGDVIPAIVKSVDSNKGNAYVCISDDLSGFIRLENFSYPPKHDNMDMATNEVGKDVTGHIFKRIIGKVIGIHENGLVELDRRQVLEEAINNLANNIGEIVNATVEEICPYGIFADIGNGVRTLIHVTECSNSRYVPIENFFAIGDEIRKVKILEFDSERKFFRTSIKQAYERSMFEPRSVVKVRVCGFIDGGAFVEFDPATTGIMDLYQSERERIETGDFVWCRIKKETKKGFKAHFISED